MTDLTRWNRAGLRRIRYVDGNAATHLDELRREAALRLPAWTALSAPAAYDAEGGEIGEELLRALARVAHVLTEHLDAYANEGFLATATQWESVRLLVAALGYEPGPPASAATPLALSAKAAGRVRAGLARTYAPPGGDPLTFETLEDLEVSPQLNQLWPAGFDRSVTPLSGRELVVEGKLTKARSGDPVVLEDERTPDRYLAFRLVSRSDAADRTTLTLDPPLDGTLLAGYTRVHAAPADRLALLGPAQTGVSTLGTSVALRDDPRTRISPGDVVVIADGERAYLRRVREVEPDRLRVFAAVGALNLTAARVVPAAALAVSGVTGRSVADGTRLLVLRVAGDWTHLIGTVAGLPTPGTVLEGRIIHADRRTAQVIEGGEARPPSTLLTLALPGATTVPQNPQALLIMPRPDPNALALDVPLQRSGAVPVRLATGRPKHAAAGDLAVLSCGRALAWGRLSEVAVDADSGTAALTFVEPLGERGGPPYRLSRSAVHAHFAAVARPVDHALNHTPVNGHAVALDAVPGDLVPGRRVIARRLDDPRLTLATTVASVHDGAVVLTDPLPAGATASTLVLHANVVTAGHGSGMPERVLGGGDAMVAGQRFELPVAGVSFIADPTMPAQVRADLVVTVEGRRWQQVARLADVGPQETAYEVRLTEAGHPVVVFGDGRRGRRLPSGRDNVHVRFRRGAGLAGLIGAGRLDGELRGHALLDGVLQPLPASGGNDREPIESLRESAPAALLTLDRAVSLTDYTSLAQRAASVWQAQAVADPAGSGRRDTVTVYVVPAGDAPLTSGLRSDLERFLNEHSPPAVSVTIEPYERIPLDCTVTIRVDPLAFDGEAVASATRGALAAALSLPSRRLGAALGRSDVFHIVEAVPGVEVSSVSIGSGGVSARRLRAQPHQVIALDPDGRGPLVEFEEYRP